MTTKHTPGPWHFFQQANAPKYCTIHNSDHTFEVADAWNEPGTDGETSLANARLIAASPELLDSVASLVNAMKRWPGTENPELFPEMKTARALLARLNID